jgi:hypothetical protein
MVMRDWCVRSARKARVVPTPVPPGGSCLARRSAAQARSCSSSRRLEDPEARRRQSERRTPQSPARVRGGRPGPVKSVRRPPPETLLLWRNASRSAFRTTFDVRRLAGPRRGEDTRTFGRCGVVGRDGDSGKPTAPEPRREPGFEARTLDLVRTPDLVRAHRAASWFGADRSFRPGPLTRS